MLLQHLLVLSTLLLGAYGEPGNENDGYGSGGGVDGGSTPTKTSPDPDGMVYTTETIKQSDGSEEYIITGTRPDTYETIVGPGEFTYETINNEGFSYETLAGYEEQKKTCSAPPTQAPFNNKAISYNQKNDPANYDSPRKGSQR
ncbi:hypothetical protein K7432_018609 [Basidiobolus ranarum]|uniref:Uncharacterized protein n=1 Tax=Basidiobolus ranarum TaxID=34480 RepID=A0ABR2VJY5_9FUNG